MRTSARCLLVSCALLVTGMRDPFRPPDDPCAVGQLAQWHYHGWWAALRTLAFYRTGKSAGIA